jgi:hypothetical protein
MWNPGLPVLISLLLTILALADHEVPGAVFLLGLGC